MSGNGLIKFSRPLSDPPPMWGRGGWGVAFLAFLALLPGYDTKMGLSRGHQHFGRNQYDAALKEFQGVLAAEPGNTSALGMVGWSLFKKGDYPGAMVAFKEYQKTYPEEADPVNGLGWTYVKMGDLVNARKSFMHSMELKSDQTDPYNGLGYISSTEGKLVESFNWFQKALSINVNDPEAHRGLGHWYFSKQQFDSSIDEMRKALRIQPQWHDCLMSIAKSYSAKKMNVEATQYFERYVEASPQDVTVGVQMAGARFAQMDYGKVVKLLGRLPDQKMEKQKEWGLVSTGLSLLGWSYFHKGDYRRSFDVFKKLADLHRENDYYADYHSGLAWNALRLNEWEVATREFTAALVMMPGDPELLKGVKELKDKREVENR